MLKLLLKKQLFEIFSPYFYDAKKNKARSKTATILYFVLFALLIVGLLGGIFTFLSVKLCAPLTSVNLEWLYFAIMGGIAILLGAFGSIFNTYAGLYLPKDNDLLLALPIPVSVLVASRLFSVYLMGLMYSAVVILPAVIVYWTTAGTTLPTVLGGILLTALISVFVLTLSCVLGWVVAKLSQKLKRKSFVVVLTSLAFIGIYYFAYFKTQSMIEDLLVNAAFYGGKIKSSAYPVYLFGSVGAGNIRASLIVTAVVSVLFGLMWVLLSKSFLRLATATGKTVHREYRETVPHQRGIEAALLNRELVHFSARPSYMLNCGLGTFLMPLCAIVILWKGRNLFLVLNAMFAETSGSVPVLLCVMLCALASMNLMAAPSVSLEGKSLWQIKSLPVEPWKVLQAKLRMQLILTIPPLFLCMICMAIVYPMPVMQLLIVILFSGSYALLMALFGLILGLKMSILSWTNEIMPIKQSAPVMITLFVGIGYTVLLFAGFLLLPGWVLGFTRYMACFIGANVILCICNYAWLQRAGTARLAAL